VKVYIDNDVVSGFRKRDLRLKELAAIDALQALADAGSVSLVVSAVHDREAAPLPEQYRQEQEKILSTFPRVEFADDYQLSAFHTLHAGRGGFITWPLFEDDAVARRLREIGLDRVDAHHVMLAIKRECAAFVTCDETTILKYRAQVEAEFPIRLMLPSEFIQRHPDTVDPSGPKGK
jgi:hypothetical protein